MGFNSAFKGLIQTISDFVLKSFSRAGYRLIRCVRRKWISLRLAVDILHVIYIKDTQILVFNFTFDLL